MKIQAVTTWEGTPKALEMLIEGSKQSGPIHESMKQLVLQLMYQLYGLNTHMVHSQLVTKNLKEMEMLRLMTMSQIRGQFHML